MATTKIHRKQATETLRGGVQQVRTHCGKRFAIEGAPIGDNEQVDCLLCMEWTSDRIATIEANRAAYGAKMEAAGDAAMTTDEKLSMATKLMARVGRLMVAALDDDQSSGMMDDVEEHFIEFLGEESKLHEFIREYVGS